MIAPTSLEPLRRSRRLRRNFSRHVTFATATPIRFSLRRDARELLRVVLLRTALFLLRAYRRV